MTQAEILQVILNEVARQVNAGVSTNYFLVAQALHEKMTASKFEALAERYKS